MYTTNTPTRFTHIHTPRTDSPAPHNPAAHRAPRSYIATALSFFFIWGNNLNLTLVVLTGIPGGIDYLLLACQYVLDPSCYVIPLIHPV